MEQINYDGHENWILYMGLGQAKYSTQLKTKIKEKHLKVAETVLHHTLK